MSPPVQLPLGQRRGFHHVTHLPPSPYGNADSAKPAPVKLPRRRANQHRPLVILHTPKEIKPEEKAEKDRCWSEVVPNIFVAFQGGGDQKVVVVEGGKKYTHIVTISLADAASSQETSTDFPDGSRVQALHLSIPNPSVALMRAWRTGLGLSPEQLASATTFLSDASSGPSTPRVLVTCAHQRQTDAMAVVLTYLSKSLQEDVDEVSKVIDMVDDLQSVWKGEVTEDELDTIRSVLMDNGWIDKQPPCNNIL